MLQQLGRNQEAITAFLEAVKTDTTCNYCWLTLVMTHDILEGRSETAKWLQELSITNFDEIATLTYRADALGGTGHYEEAIITFTEALKR